MNKHALISGGGVSGLALAYWLTNAGFRVTVVERSPEWRAGGQALTCTPCPDPVAHCVW